MNSGLPVSVLSISLGRVLNRFSKDIGFMDALLPNKLLECITVSDVQIVPFVMFIS